MTTSYVEDRRTDGCGCNHANGAAVLTRSLSLLDPPPFLSRAVDACMDSLRQLTSTVANADNPANLSRALVRRETGVDVDANPYHGLARSKIEAVVHAAYHARAMPEVLLAKWAKEGSTAMTVLPQIVPQATTAANARTLARSSIYYVQLGVDWLTTTYRPNPHADNVLDDRDSTAPAQERQFAARVAELVSGHYLSEDITAAVDAELAVAASGGTFSVQPSTRFYALSLMLVDAVFARFLGMTFPEIGSPTEELGYLLWNMGEARFREFLRSADGHRREPAYAVGGQPISIERWSLHTAPKANEWVQARRNAIRFAHYIRAYKPIFRTALTLIKPGIEDVRTPSNAASFSFEDDPLGIRASRATSRAMSVMAAGGGRGRFRHEPLGGTAGDNVEARWNVPAGTAAGTTLDVVVHLHGYGANKGDEHGDFIASKAHMAGVDLADASGTVRVRASRPTLALVPRGRFVSGNVWRFDRLATIVSFDAFVTAALDWLGSSVLGLSAHALRPGRLTLMAHSGGGAGLSTLLGNGLDPDEVVCFDSIYGGDAPIVAWMRRRLRSSAASSSGLRAFYTGCGSDSWSWRNGAWNLTTTEVLTRRLKYAIDAALSGNPQASALASRYRVERTAVAHAGIPRAYTAALLDDVAATLPRVSAVPGPEVQPPCVSNADWATRPPQHPGGDAPPPSAAAHARSYDDDDDRSYAMSEPQSVPVDALFEVLTPPPSPDRSVRVTLRSRYIEEHGGALAATVGGQALEGLSHRPNGPELVGFLRRVPARGDEVVLEEGSIERRTGIRYLCDGDASHAATARSFSLTPEQQRALTDLAAFTPAATQATVPNALGVLRAIGAFYGIPWCLGYVTLEHEGGVRAFHHHDGVMQTTSGARSAAIHALPRELKLALLELPQSDSIADRDLEARLQTEFARPRLAVQIACGMTELKTNLDLFNGYIALAWIAYNAGAGWAYHLATRGRSKSRPGGITPAAWEDACRFGATLAHQAPSAMRIDNGVWQCDRNIPAWFKAFFVKDRPTDLTVVAYQYLRSISARIRANHPTTPCDATTHGHREEGTGELRLETTRDGVLDKLYAPATKLARDYRPAASDFPRLTDDGRPLKVSGGTLVAMAQVARGTSFDDDGDGMQAREQARAYEADDDEATGYALDAACVIRGARITCGGCTATERRVRRATGRLVNVPAEHVVRGTRNAQLSEEASAALVRMRQAAIADGVVGPNDPWLKLVSGYRDYASQATNWKEKLRTVFASFGCSNWAAIAPVVDATSRALAPDPAPQAPGAWSSRFATELARAGVTPADCDPDRMRAAAAAEHRQIARNRPIDPVSLAIDIGRQTVAPPGVSPHHTGYAADLMLGSVHGADATTSAARNVTWQRSQPYFAWLVCNAEHFGFYPYNREPWHWEYNPPASA
jgi:hypothetical protein